MSPRAATRFNSWDTTRYELLNTRICDLGVQIEGSLLEPYIRRLYRELSAKRLIFRPQCYLTDSWGCPDQVPVIGIPFYLADVRLRRIEEEQTGEVEDAHLIMMLLRHEAAHAFNYAYRLWERKDWQEVFGSFHRPYREVFKPEPSSREFVRHLASGPHGRTYAQKHPDEDFAETFAVWLTPRSNWRRRYRGWPALAKLQYVSRLMRRIGKRMPPITSGELLNPVEKITALLSQHYGERAERFRAAAQGYVDDRLRELFPPIPLRGSMTVARALRTHRDFLLARMTRWSDLRPSDAEAILTKVIQRAHTLRLRFPQAQLQQTLMDLAALTTALAMDFAYTGQLLD
ncbi:MAG: hypothetical protein N2595_01220 [bacterium]|nr:hypothetical protein [bacterium]